MNKLPARTGWQWLTHGFSLFRKQPGMLSTLLVANLLTNLMLASVPLLGAIAAAVLIPSFSVAFMQANHLLDQGQRLAPSVLLTGFRPPALRELCKLGLAYMVLAILLMALSMLFVDEAFVKRMQIPAGSKTPPQFAAGDVLTFMLLIGVQAGLMLALCFAPALTYWKKMKPFKAIFYSVFGILGAFKPFVTMLAAWIGFLLAASMIVALLLGGGKAGVAAMFSITLVFTLILQSSLYACYRQIFGDPAAPPDKLDDVVQLKD